MSQQFSSISAGLASFPWPDALKGDLVCVLFMFPVCRYASMRLSSNRFFGFVLFCFKTFTVKVMLLKVSEPVEKDNIAGRTGSSGPPGLEPWLFSKRFTRLVEQNLNLCVATVGSLMAFLREICSPVFDCWSLMFQSPEKTF